MTRKDEILKAAREKQERLQRQSAAHWQQTKEAVEADQKASIDRIKAEIMLGIFNISL